MSELNAETAFHVAVDGNDAHAGTPAEPFASLGRAVEAARVERRKIVVHGGEYFDTQIALGPEDNGLTIEAAPGEAPVLYGGRRVSEWERDGDFIMAELPGVKDGSWDFRALLVNGEFRPRARLPREGAFTYRNVFDVRWMSTTYGGWERKPTEEELTTLLYKDDDLGPWLDVRNAEIRIYHMWDESLVGVKSIDTANRLVTFTTPSGHPPGAFNSESNTKANMYVVYNVREGMHEPGMWYLDRTAGRLVYWPLPGEDISKLHVVAPTTESIVRMTGRDGEPLHNITLRGLEFAATSTPLVAAGFGAGKLDGAINVAGPATGVTLENLTIRHVAGHGIKVSGEGVSGTRIENCTMRSTGASAIVVRGAESLVTRNTVRDAGVLYPSALGVTVSGTDCVIGHNDICGTSYTALHGGGKRTRFEHNIMRDFMRDLDDGAAIYVFAGDEVVYRGNVAYGATGRWASAYYLDERCENCIVEENIAINTKWPSHNHMAKDNVIRNNVFVDDGKSQLTFPRCEGFVFERNIVYAGGEIFLSGINAIDDMPNNIFYSAVGVLECEALDDYSGTGKMPLGLRDGSVAADPMFVDAANGDFGFRPGSPAEKLGIKALKM